jgi:hypothetical protein
LTRNDYLSWHYELQGVAHDVDIYGCSAGIVAIELDVAVTFDRDFIGPEIADVL